jgi:hypothetical protein
MKSCRGSTSQPIHRQFCDHANDDSEKVGGSNAEHSAFMYIALKRAGVPVELHIYATGNHDFGCARTKNFHRAGRSSASTGSVVWTC